MEAIAEKNKLIFKKTTERKPRNTIRPKKNEPKASHQLVHLNTNDYDYLIKWKRERAEQQSNRSVMFFFIGLALALTAVIIAFEWNFEKEAIIKNLVAENTIWEETQDIPLTSQPPPPPPKQIIQQPVIVEVPDDEILEEIEVDMDVEVTEDMAVEEVEFTMEIEEEEAEEIFLLVEDKPEPKGGIKAFYEYVSKNLKYPQIAIVNEIQGRVFVQFVVNSEGKISDVQAVKGIGGGCDEEAVRIVSQAPDWNPGKQRGKPVSVRMVIPITFKLFRN